MLALQAWVIWPAPYPPYYVALVGLGLFLVLTRSLIIGIVAITNTIAKHN